MRHVRFIAAAVFACVLPVGLGGCEAYQRFMAPVAMEARDDVILIKGDMTGIRESVDGFALAVKDLGLLTEAGEARVDAIVADIGETMNNVGVRIDDAVDKLKPEVVAAAGISMKDLGDSIGGTAGSVLGGIGILATFLGERRGRRRIVRQIVQSVEDGRTANADGTFNIGAVMKAQENMGISRYVRNVTGDIPGKHALE